MKRNPIREAVDKLGGVTRASVACKCSNTAVHQWIRDGRIPSAIYAVRLAEASGMPIADLVGDPERQAG